MLSHAEEPEPLEAVVARIRERLDGAEARDVLDRLAAFPFGRFLLLNRGWNGYWTQYAVVYHPTEGRRTGLDPHARPLTDLEKRILDMPLCRATQERFTHFQRVLQREVREGVRMASLPCGLMGELLSLDFSNVVNFSLIGIDLDADALRQAAEQAALRGLTSKVELRREDGWTLVHDGFDALSSNGLNLYEADDARVIALYRAFHRRLRDGGTLVTSYLSTRDEYDLSGIDPEELRLQRIVFTDILQANFNHFRSTALTTSQLETAGFEVVEIRRDSAGMFPTVIARAR